MAQGKINLRKLNLMGYTPATQAFVVQNAGGVGSVATSYFLQSIARFMDHTSFGYVIHAPRVDRFKAFCARKGFEVAQGEPL